MFCALQILPVAYEFITITLPTFSSSGNITWTQSFVLTYNQVYRAPFGSPEPLDQSINFYLAAVLLLTQFVTEFSSYFLNSLVLIMALTMWSAAYVFARTLRKDMGESAIKVRNNMPPKQGLPGILGLATIVDVEPEMSKWEEVKQEYMLIKDYFERFNKLFGSLLLSYLGASILAYSIVLNEVFNVQIVSFIGYFSGLVAYSLFADAAHQVFFS